MQYCHEGESSFINLRATSASPPSEGKKHLSDLPFPPKATAQHMHMKPFQIKQSPLKYTCLSGKVERANCISEGISCLKQDYLTKLRALQDALCMLNNPRDQQT